MKLIAQNIWYVIEFYIIARLIPQTTNLTIAIVSYTYFYSFQPNMTHTDYLQVSHTQTGTTKNCNIQSENEYVSLEQYS